MSIGTQEILTPAYVPELPPDDLLSEDGEPLESQWHLLQILLLLECVNERFRARNDYFAGGNMFLYFDAQQLLSPTTAVEDRGPKKDTYEQVFRTRELFLADPTSAPWRAFAWAAKPHTRRSMSARAAGFGATG